MLVKIKQGGIVMKNLFRAIWRFAQESAKFNEKVAKEESVTEQTIAQCIWNGMFTRRGPLPEEVRKRIKPGMSREKIIGIIKKYLLKR